MPKSRKNKRSPKRVLALPDLEQSKTAVMNSLTSKSGQQSYDHAITAFVEWYCSAPRLAFHRTVVLRYRIYLEQKQYAPTTINLRLAAVRRVAYEAAGLESVPGTGSRLSRASGCQQPPRAIYYVAKETTQSSRRRSDVDYAAAICLRSASMRSNCERITGSWLGQQGSPGKSPG
jgi:hypothetical protein